MRSMSRVTSSIAIFMVLGCGVSKDPHYLGKKHFGAPPPAVEEEAEVEEAEANPIPKAGPSEQPERNEPTSSTPPVVIENPGEVEEPATPIDPRRVVFAGFYRGAVDIASIRAIDWNGKMMDPKKSAFTRKLLAQIPTGPDAKVYFRQEYGDGNGSGILTQTSFSKLADLGVYLGKESGSGTSVMHRGVGLEGCGTMWSCMAKYDFAPTSPATNGGESGRTFCFYDRQQQRLVPLPYSPSPMYAERDYDAEFAKHQGTVVMGPFDVLKLRGKNRDCADADPVRDRVDRIIVRFKKLNPAMRRLVAGPTLPKADFAIDVYIEQLGNGLNERPYVDETANLKHRSRYFINEAGGIIVKSIQDVRIGLVSNSEWNPIPGLFAEMHVEYCRDYLQGQAINHCAHLEGR